MIRLYQSKNTYWLGYNDMDKEGRFVDLCNRDTLVEDWRKFEPNNNLFAEDCVAMNVMKDYFVSKKIVTNWNDHSCYLKLNYICSSKRPCSPPPTTAATLVNALEFIQDGRRYAYYSDFRTWPDARKQCQQRGMDLAIIESKREQNQLEQRSLAEGVSSVFSMWIGVSDLTNEGDFRDVCGRKLSYTAWDLNQPNNNRLISPEGEDCVEMIVFQSTVLKYIRFTWKDSSCRRKRQYLCEEVSCSSPTTTVTTSAPTRPSSTYSGSLHPISSRSSAAPVTNIVTTRKPNTQPPTSDSCVDPSWCTSQSGCAAVEYKYSCRRLCGLCSPKTDKPSSLLTTLLITTPISATTIKPTSATTYTTSITSEAKTTASKPIVTTPEPETTTFRATTSKSPAITNLSSTFKPTSPKLFTTTESTKTTPSPSKTSSEPLKTTPASMKTTSVSVKTTPAPVKTTPAPVKTTPVPVKTTPAPVTTTPAPMKTTPEPMKTTPEPLKTTPAPVKTTPAPVKTTPAPMKTTPVPIKTTPAPVKTTPAPVKTTPQASTITPRTMTTTSKPTTFRLDTTTVKLTAQSTNSEQTSGLTTENSCQDKAEQCAGLGDNREEMCKIPDIRLYCPKTCQTCIECFDQLSVEQCAQAKQNLGCNNDVLVYCPATCKVC